MPANNTETIFPCPLSKSYSIPAQQAWVLLKVYLTYRFALACLFVFLFYGRLGFSLSSIDNDQLYAYSSHTYLILSTISAICVFWKPTRYSTQAQLLIFTDIVILTLIMHACGGVNSGIGTLLAVSIASSGLLIGGRCSIFFAALASLFVLAEQIFADYSNSFASTSYTYAGMLGASFFTIALLSYILAKRSEQTLQLADQQKLTIDKLEELNQYIIQHLQSGIIIINKQQTIQMANVASLQLVNLSSMPDCLRDISENLSRAFSTWLADPKEQTVQIQLPNQSKIHCRFMILPIVSASFYMIILEDIDLYNQHLQQSKLASLGRLTASIAHEIRNPLGAISHAGQLLSENPNLPIQDIRLIKIIQTNSIRISQIVDDILQLSKRADSRREKVYLKPWLTHYLNNFMLEQGIDARSFKLSQTDNSLCAFIDPGHLKQIMDNLCHNALKYGEPEAGHIIVQVVTLKNSPCIQVIDNGSGISREYIKYLFEPFFTTSASGTGLGLYISKELAELNQAKLSYRLTEEKQSCFQLCLLDANQTKIEI
ncbi:MAG: HAMP domain-containing sensor histidine kinase [Methylococcales bacterium]|nr:HAMP domain-containing sensor histidine kinase [Methylococcales bacterium]